MNDLLHEKVGEVVARDFRTAPVFKRHRIDFCCGGGITIEAACSKAKTDPGILESELNEAMRSANRSAVQEISEYPLDELISHIELTHHRYVERRSSEIKGFLDKVVRVHGDKKPELAQIQLLFEEGVGQLAQHMKKEELILFPAIRRMIAAERAGTAYEMAPFGSIENPIHMMEHEHEVEGDRFDSLAQLTDNYTPPDWACNTFKVTYALLQEFEQDLHVHIHLENNVLFPKAIALEKQWI